MDNAISVTSVKFSSKQDGILLVEVQGESTLSIYFLMAPPELGNMRKQTGESSFPSIGLSPSSFSFLSFPGEAGDWESSISPPFPTNIPLAPHFPPPALPISTFLHRSGGRRLLPAYRENASSAALTMLVVCIGEKE